MAAMLHGRRILLVIAGGIAAYKSLDLIRRLRERGAATRCILTKGGAQFVTPLSVATLSRDKVFQDLFSLTDESEIGHIRLARECDLVVVSPATADLLAKMAHGLADDLASTVLLATDKSILVAPAMNVVMWDSKATQGNLATLRQRGVHTVGPEAGELAEGETGMGRMSEPLAIVAAIEALFGSGPLAGKRALVTSGPTYEAVDPVRFIGNRSSGKQGHAIAAALARLGADTTLVTGPTQQADPRGVRVTHIESADEMLAACRAALPVDIAVCAAAVADWKPRDRRNQKIKKNGSLPALELVETPDILASSRAEVQKVLADLDALSAQTLVALEVSWLPADEDERMSTATLEALHPDMKKLPGVVGGRVFCEYCKGPYAAELPKCPHCGAPTATAAAGTSP